MGRAGRLAKYLPVVLGGLGPVSWLLKDDFTDTRAAGAVNGTPGTPTGGNRTVVDTTNKLSIGSGLANFTPGVDWGNPGLWYGARTRMAGRLLLISVEGLTTIDTGNSIDAGWGAAQNGIIGEAALVGTGSLLNARGNGVNIQLLAARSNVVYKLAVVLRAAGAFYFIKGGAFRYWTLIHAGSAGSAASVYPGLTHKSDTWACGYIRVPDELWLPAPAASDGFSGGFGATDGLGHAETSGLGAGGSGKVWTQNVGSFASAAGKASGTTAGGLAVATVDAGTPYVYSGVTPTRAGGSVGLELWRTDEDNCLRLYHDGTNLVFSTIIGGAETKKVNAAAALGRIEIVLYRLSPTYAIANVYCNGVKVGAEISFSNTTLTPNNNIGLYSTNDGNTFDDFVVYPVGNSNEHRRLDRYMDVKPIVNYLPIGDSKTECADGNSWEARMETTTTQYREWPERIAHSGYTTAQLHAAWDAEKGSRSGTPDEILINCTVNDFAAVRAGTLLEPAWSADMAGMVDDAHALYPNANIRLMKCWKRGYDAEALTYAGWIDNFVAARPGWCFAGPDESVFLKGADDGATYTSDGVHPNAAGYSLTAQQWRAVIEA